MFCRHKLEQPGVVVRRFIWVNFNLFLVEGNDSILRALAHPWLIHLAKQLNSIAIYVH